jgi:hypothetical protein
MRACAGQPPRFEANEIPPPFGVGMTRLKESMGFDFDSETRRKLGYRLIDQVDQ